MKLLKTLSVLLICLFSGVAMAQDAAFQPEHTSIAKTVSIYPNPATEYIEINLDQLDANKVKLSLYNIIGNEMPVETEVISDHKMRVRVKDFAAGYYLVALRDDETKFKGTYKFLKR
ncbi:MAG: T9SS type A sorting domain-containing protein [Cyclobacteriaceae bacterium]|nr:T9SS type A sorting domain-containing protein [Cyclobacteriaceae bacterium]